MALMQVDLWKSVAYPDNPSGKYYWSSVYYIDSAQAPNPLSAYTQARSLDRGVTRQIVTYEKGIIKSPPGRTSVIATIPDGFSTGLMANAEGPYTLTSVGRWRLQSSAGRWTYKYLRGPVFWEEIADGMITGTAALFFAAFQNTMTFQNRWRDSYGDLIVSGKFDYRARMWQLRHGTKRRERSAPA